MDRDINMEYQAFDFIQVREKIVKYSKKQLDEFINQLKTEADKVSDQENKYHPAKLFYMLHLLTLYQIKFVDVDTWQFEEIYIYLMNEDIDKPDQMFPFEYKLEFLYILATIFNSNGYYTKSELIFDKIQKIYEANNENILAANKLIDIYLCRCFEVWSITSDNPEDYFKGIDPVKLI